MRTSTETSGSRRIDSADRAEAAQAKALLAAIVESSDDAIFSRSPDGTIQTWNASAEWLYGYSAEEIVGRTVAMLEPADLRGQADAAFARVLAGGPAERFETRRLCMDGSEVPVSVHLSPVVDGTTVTGVSSIARDISAQKMAEAALRESESRLAEAQRLAHVGSWSLDTATGRRIWSDELYRLLGYQPGAFEPDLEHLFARLHPDDAAGVRAAVLCDVSRAQPSENEFRIVLPGGQVRWLAARTEPVLDETGGMIGVHGTTQDVTQRKQTEERLRFQAHLLDAVGEAVIATDLTGAITYWGPGAEELYGWTAHEALSRNIGEVTPSDATAEAAVEVMGRLAQGERWAGLMEVRRRDGSTFLAEIVDTPVLDAGRLVAVIGISTDVTAREQANAELASARDAALEASVLKSHFLANMSHEIRTPMNGILGMTELLLDSPLDASQREFAETVRISGDALLTIINDILDLSKVEAGVVELESVDFELSSVIRNVTELLAGAAAAKGLDMQVHVADDVPALRGDPLRIRQVLTNLIGNAVKFTPAGGGVVVSGRVVATDGTRATVRLQVDDTGIGIGPDEMERVFEPFAQADSSTTRRFGGTGLGLTITRQLVDLMGGRYGVDSTLGRGSTFWCTLPLLAAIGTAPGPAGGTRPGCPEVPVAVADGPRCGAVLLAEDNLINRKVAVAMLEGGGYHVDVAVDGAEAVDAVRAGHYDVVLMDCQMPRMDGYEAAAAIRAEEGSGRHVPIVAMTAGAMPEDRERALAAGMDDYLAKPVRRADVLAAVSRWAETG
jgi:PAS domain S-box-containing protein